MEATVARAAVVLDSCRTTVERGPRVERDIAIEVGRPSNGSKRCVESGDLVWEPSARVLGMLVPVWCIEPADAPCREI